jgi:hypothetical protein
MAAWASGAAVAAPAPARKPRPRPRPKARPRRRPALLGGVVWIGILAALLAGIVALNVAALQLNVRLDRLAETKAELRATGDALSARLTHAGSPPQVAAVATRRLGLMPASPSRTSYVDLARPGGK